MLCFHGLGECPWCFEPAVKVIRHCRACARELIGKERVHCSMCRSRNFYAQQFKGLGR